MHHVGLILYPDFQVLGLSMCSAFELANNAVGKRAYEISLLSEHGGLVQTSAGFGIDTKPLVKRPFDTLIVTGYNRDVRASPALVNYLREAEPSTRRIGSICTGAYILAAAGLLDGRRATTHWESARAFQRLFPKVKVEEDRIFINDGKVWTSAGMSACVDLALALVEQDLGHDVARRVAKQLVLYHRRAGGQSQFSVMLQIQPRTDRIQAALIYAKDNLKSELSVDDLARVANLSPRQFRRVFQTETGQSPAKAIENLRLETARLLIEGGYRTVDSIARETGFGDRERMRRAFVRAFGQPPQVIQRASRA
ncbi:AraC family transcriptional regulator [Caballeronia terrestris]|uniref:AraC family transcriptional regulator n=1 Tax=Caballeronia terrestris TaxID=1226301 RepID=A0A158GVH2_9BURK|nr:GlxA family transcriptional regulator [Caballeronia terrestris]SAL35837.1 AraC family transcriptional regulator [Caballeronia terrestris]